MHLLPKQGPLLMEYFPKNISPPAAAHPSICRHARTDGRKGFQQRGGAVFLGCHLETQVLLTSPLPPCEGREEDEGRLPVGSQSGSSPNSIFAAHSARREGSRAAFLADRQTRRSFNFTDYNLLTCWQHGMQKQLELFKA